MEPLAIGLKVADIASDQLTNRLQFNQSKRLMDIQQANQMELNKQGQAIQLDTWEKTNYPAQVAMLKKAGLNPGLLYSKTGSGGVTGSQGGGSASSGQMPFMPTMDISSILMMKQQQASIKALEAEANLKNAEANKIEGVDTTKTESEISKIIAETSNERLKGELIKIQTANEAIKTSMTQEMLDSEIELIKSQINKLNAEGNLIKGNTENIIKETALNVIGKTLENELTKSKTNLTDVEKTAIITNTVQEWTRLSIEGKKLDLEAKQQQINKFTQEMKYQYPSLMETFGMVTNKAFKSLELLTEFMSTGRYNESYLDNPKVDNKK